MSDTKQDTPAQTIGKLRDTLSEKVAKEIADFELKSGMRVTGLNIVTVDTKKTVSVTLSIE